MENDMNCRAGMMNIGNRPTFGGDKQTLEVNIFDFTGDLYGQLLMVSFEHRIRGERKFSSPEALARQLTTDQEIIKQKFKEEL
jgi:riboflavin kinase/FMN adenylyltransferase